MSTDDGRLADPGRSLLQGGLILYGAMAAIALVWRVGLVGESIVYASPEAAAVGAVAPGLLWGLAAGVVLLVLSHLLTEWTDFGKRLARALAELLGDLPLSSALVLALASGIAEEMLFRGALQPHLGWIGTGVLFGLVHFVPRREFLPWTAFAIVAGLVFGWLVERTGSLIAPVVAHVLVNAVNLPLLVHQYGVGRGESAPTGDESPPTG